MEKGARLGQEGIELVINVPNWTTLEYRSLYAQVIAVRRFWAMCLDGQNASLYDRAGVNQGTDIGV